MDRLLTALHSTLTRIVVCMSSIPWLMYGCEWMMLVLLNHMHLDQSVKSMPEWIHSISSDLLPARRGF